MRRNNAVEVKVKGPFRGLQTRYPSNQPIPDDKTIVVAENVRADRGVLRNAPGYERIIPSPRNLDTPANMIWQANLLDPDREMQTTPFVGTGSSLYTLRRRSRAVTCVAGGGGSVGSCAMTAAFLGDSGKVGANLLAVSSLIKSRSPDIVVHLGDIVYADGVVDPTVADYEECVGQYFGADYVGGYAGLYGFGPAENKFFPVLGNHDWDDAGIANYLDFFQLAKNPNERYYHYKRGPVHFIHYSGYEASEPDGVALGSVQATWLEGVLAASDCPHILFVVHFPLWTSDINNYPGYTALQTLAPLLRSYGAVIVSGHSHNSEICLNDGLYNLISGSGGHSIRAFHAPPSPYSIWKDNSAYGALFLDADRETLSFDWVTAAGVSLQTLDIPAAREGSGICYIGDAAKEIFTLEIRPDYASVEVGFSWPFRCYANYQDGTIAEVTTQCVWTSNHDSIATAASTTGIVTGNSPGDVVITATYRGVSDTANLRVRHTCLDDGREVVFCLSRAASMAAYASGASRLDAVKDAVELSIDAFDPALDKMGIVSFAGTFATQTEDATLDAPLSANFSSVKNSLSLLVPDGANGISAGLDAAYAELTGVRHVTDSARAAVLVVDFPADVTSPGGDASSEAAAIVAAMTAAAASATTLKALSSMILVVVGYNVPAAYEAAVSALATDGYYYGVETPDELRTTLADLAHNLCYFGDGYYYYYIDHACGSPIPDYTGFFDWDVVRGCVDLCGIGTGGDTSLIAWDPRPGNGMYLDMTGTDVDNSPDHDTTCGKIQTKVAYSVTAGKQYKLSLYACNYSGSNTYVDVSFGDFLAPQRCQPADGPFILIEYTFTPSTSGSAKIVIDSEVHVETRANPFTGVLVTLFPTKGVLIDRVKLENVTDSEELFYNDFDAENPCVV